MIVLELIPQQDVWLQCMAALLIIIGSLLVIGLAAWAILMWCVVLDRRR